MRQYIDLGSTPWQAVEVGSTGDEGCAFIAASLVPTNWDDEALKELGSLA